MSVNQEANDTRSRRFSAAGYLLGFSLGGFFDGILLHQILQWHHLLSAVQGDALQDLHIQILADGFFHVLMYVLAVWGLFLLWKSRGGYERGNADRVLLGNAFMGFGAWNIVDGLLSHWILGIHRIRMDAANPLFWDLLWFFVFGVAFVAIGWFIRRSRQGGNTDNPSHGAAWMLALTVAAAGPVAALPPQGGTTTLVFFKSDTPGVDVFRAAEAAQARVIWTAASGNLWALDMPDDTKKAALYDYGAYWISNSPLLVGCLAWSSTSAAG